MEAFTAEIRLESYPIFAEAIREMNREYKLLLAHADWLL